MAKNNACDVLTGDWNPIIGCQRYSAGCRKCWFLDALFPWQQRLGRISPEVQPNTPYVFEERLNSAYLRPKNGIVGVCQHGDLFWDLIPDALIHRVLDVIDRTAPTKRNPPKYILWTKRAERMHSILTARYPHGTPGYIACAVSMENQAAVDERLPFLLATNTTRIVVIEPMLGPVTLPSVEHLDWIIVGSETGKDEPRPRPTELDWARRVRDQAVEAHVPFFLKQLNSLHGSHALRELDGESWNEFPPGFTK